MEDQNKTLQVRIKEALASMLKAQTMTISQLYSALLMLSICRTHIEQVDVLSILSYDFPDLNKILVSERTKIVAF